MAVAITACSDQPDPVQPVRSAALVAEAGNYLLIASGQNLPGNLDAWITSAGGRLGTVMNSVGVATATSADPQFAVTARKIPGVQYVVADPMLAWVKPGRTALLGAPSGSDFESFASLADNELLTPLQWHLNAVQAPAAWALGYTGSGVRVAVIDGGLSVFHPDLAPNIDLARSRSFVIANGATVPLNTELGGFWHGTHVAGIVAAANDNAGPGNSFLEVVNNGAIGIAPNATLIGIKALHGQGGLFSWVLQGILYAATPIAEGGAGADIINMSLGVELLLSERDEPGFLPGAALLVAVTRVVKYAEQRGVTVIAAAGNSALDLDRTANIISIPAQLPGVIAVSATGPVGFAHGATNFTRPASYTNFGASAIHLAAPGGDAVLPGDAICVFPLAFGLGTVNPCWAYDLIISTNHNGYAFAAGTSVASPVVAGVAALVIQKYGRIGPARVAQKLREAADDLGKPGNDPYYGRGFVNALKAVQ